MENEIVKAEQEAPLMRIISAASADGNIDADKLMKLLEVNERYEANQARKAYVVAMAAFKTNPPEILRDKTVSYKQTHYNHASLQNVTSCINAELSKHGLTASWVTDQTDGSVKVICKITHVLGHSEETSLTAPPDTTGSKNNIQAIGSTITYLERYTILALTGLATLEQDDDGAGSNDETVPKPSAKAAKVLLEICNKMVDSVPEDRVLLDVRVEEVIFGLKGEYPEDIDKAGTIAAWFVGILNKNDTWNSVTRETGDF